MTIRPARMEAIPALLEIYNYEVINGVATLDLNPRTLPEWEEWFREHQTEDHFILTAEIDGVPCRVRFPVGIPQQGGVPLHRGAFGVRRARIPQAGSRLRTDRGSPANLPGEGNAPQRGVSHNRRKRCQRAPSQQIRIHGVRVRSTRWASSMENTRISTISNLSWTRSKSCSVR